MEEIYSKKYNSNKKTLKDELLQRKYKRNLAIISAFLAIDPSKINDAYGIKKKKERKESVCSYSAATKPCFRLEFTFITR